MEDGGGPSLSGVLDGEEPLLTIKESSPSGADHLMDGVPAAQAFRHREVMLLQAVLERYSDRSAPASSHHINHRYLYLSPPQVRGSHFRVSGEGVPGSGPQWV